MADPIGWFKERAPAFWFGCRTATAIVVAIGVALAMNWHRPEWAGIAVMSISQDSAAATLGKGRLRLGATLIAAVCALTMIALFPQDRWGFFLALSLCGNLRVSHAGQPPWLRMARGCVCVPSDCNQWGFR